MKDAFRTATEQKNLTKSSQKLEQAIIKESEIPCYSWTIIR